jgi:hypothetical protein
MYHYRRVMMVLGHGVEVVKMLKAEVQMAEEKRPNNQMAE